MKTYTTQNGRLAAGLEIIADERLGRVVFLGEDGRGRAYEKIKLDSRRPPTVIENRVEDADVDSFDAGGKKRFALVFPHGLDYRILVRAHCGAVYTKGTSGSAAGYWGSPQKLVAGFGAFGDAGRIGTWDDGLWTMSPGDALSITPSGGYKVTPYILWYQTAGEMPQVWRNHQEWRAEVLAGVLANATVEAIEKALAVTEKKGHKALSEFIRGKLAEQALISGTTTTVRRNPRWSAERSAVIVDSATVFRGTEVKTEQVLADPTNTEEARHAAALLAENVGEVKAARSAIIAAGEAFAKAGNIRPLPYWEIQSAQAELLLGCVTAEEACKRDLSSITLENWVSKADQDRIRSARPAMILFGGKEYSVEYSYGGQYAKVEVPFGDLTPQTWLGLTGDLKLTDGLSVQIKVKGEGWEAETQGNLGQLPAKIQAAAATAQLHLWTPPPAETPAELEFGDMPPNLELVYGQDVLTSAPLVARAAWHFSFWGSPEVRWGKVNETPLPKALRADELERVRKYLLDEKAERAETLAREAAQLQVEQVQKDLVALQRQPGFSELDSETKNLVQYRSGPGWTATEKMTWVTESKALIAKFECTLAINLREQAETERREREAKAKADAADTAKYKVLLTETVYEHGIALLTARKIGAFVQDAIKVVGLRAAAKILRDELHGNYGRGRRTDALNERLPGVDHRGLDWAADRDIRDVTRWAEHLLTQNGDQPASGITPQPTRGGYGGGYSRTNTGVTTAAPTPAPVVTTFAHAGKRDFKCAGCNCFTSLPGAMFEQYKAGAEVALTCGICKKQGTVKK